MSGGTVSRGWPGRARRLCVRTPPRTMRHGLDGYAILIDDTENRYQVELAMGIRSDAEQIKLLAGAIAHLSSWLDTGCPRAAHLARLLLRRLDGSQLDQELAASCERLDQAISNPR